MSKNGSTFKLVSSPCAGCKFLRRKCQPDCIFAPYFPPDQSHKFQIVHRIFGAINVSKMLQEIPSNCRMDAVGSLANEAEMRLRDPVHGCIGFISILSQQLTQLRTDLSLAKAELVKCQCLGLTNHTLLAAVTAPTTTTNAGTSSNPYHHHPQPYPMLNMDANFMGTGTSSLGYDQFYQQNHHIFKGTKNVGYVKFYQQNRHIIEGDTKPSRVIRTFGGTSNYVTENHVALNEIITGGHTNKFRYPSTRGGERIESSRSSQGFGFNS